jgi:hypothetical protein
MEMPVPKNPDENQLTTILLAHEQARARAWRGKNRQALDILLAPDYVEINLLGRMKKHEVLASLLPALDLHEFTIRNPVLISVSDQSAILTCLCHEDFTFHAKRTCGDFYAAAHYVHRNNKWLLVFRQVTPLSNDGAEG